VEKKNNDNEEYEIQSKTPQLLSLFDSDQCTIKYGSPIQLILVQNESDKIYTMFVGNLVHNHK
jgi:hypothetical protein